MAQLQEIKNRIKSVYSTQKITSAMMMISTSRLAKVQRLVENLYPYEQSLYHFLQQLTEPESPIHSPFQEERAVRRVAIMVFSSNTGLAGRFNDEITEKTKTVITDYLPLGKENILLFPVGEKITKAIRKMGFEPYGDYNNFCSNPSYNEAQQIADILMEMYRKGEIDRVELLYHHFLSKGTQRVIHEPFLPIATNTSRKDTPATNYIIEPDRATILTQLIPKILKTKLYRISLDSLTSEHAARTTAMRVATDNADDLTSQLTLEYNKLRQQSITNELLDLAGGSFE